MNNVKINIELTISDPKYFLMTASGEQATQDYIYDIQRLDLLIPIAEVTESLYQRITSKILKTPSTITAYPKNLKMTTIAKGVKEYISCHDIINAGGSMPERAIVFLTTQEAIDGNYSDNPHCAKIEVLPKNNIKEVSMTLNNINLTMLQEIADDDVASLTSYFNCMTSLNYNRKKLYY